MYTYFTIILMLPVICAIAIHTYCDNHGKHFNKTAVTIACIGVLIVGIGFYAVDMCTKASCVTEYTQKATITSKYVRKHRCYICYVVDGSEIRECVNSKEYANFSEGSEILVDCVVRQGVITQIMTFDYEARYNG